MGGDEGRGDKKCALCEGEARMYCESDEASLCWECDARVHGANFLVARHTRFLLCRSCRSPTAWRAAGPRLAPTVSLCPKCCFADNRLEEREEEEMEEGGEEEEEEDEGDCQVVPLSLTLAPPPPAAAEAAEEASSSSSDGSSFKRMRSDSAMANLRSRPQDDRDAPSASSQQTVRIRHQTRSAGGDDATSSKEGRGLFRLTDERNRSAPVRAVFSPSGDPSSLSCSPARPTFSTADFVKC